MYDAVTTGSMPTDRASLISLAFLALKVDEPLRFASIVENNKLNGLLPFIEFAEKE